MVLDHGAWSLMVASVPIPAEIREPGEGYGIVVDVTGRCIAGEKADQAARKILGQDGQVPSGGTPRRPRCRRGLGGEEFPRGTTALALPPLLRQLRYVPVGIMPSPAERLVK
ncbi:hypothetical protein [Streptomyces sp. NPDC001889]